MRGVNETIARMANQEEGCKGRFWEGRFKSMAHELYDSDFTSIQQRLFEYGNTQTTESKPDHNLNGRMVQQQMLKQAQDLDEWPEAALMPFDGSSHTEIDTALPFTREDYCQLVGVTGRIIRDDKRGSIPDEIPSVVSRLGIDPDRWIEHIQRFSQSYGACIGSGESITNYAIKSGKQWCKGVSHSVQCYHHVDVA